MAYLARESPKFRGNWAPSLPDPCIQSFVPVQSVYVVKKKPVEEIRAPPPVIKVNTKEVKEVDVPNNVKLEILDRERLLRSFITEDGTCTNKWGELIGYINMKQGTCGSPEEDYWGCIDEGEFEICQVLDKDDNVIGELDLGRAIIKDDIGDVVADLDNAGEGRGNDGSFIGQFVHFTYRDLKTIALYLLIIDPNMYNTYENV
eukprot:CAMPEP_0174260944 /NCGR_PEP_ID=MMETSP0439-20130205/11078_1 /TAXON_ID=0 /ORGANISM="Stereomyxa ramosa, Strain Chinc5" /LENGTH=202 /DNA_ID=CAMNT_0015345335 /DNA_START=8 /DNA_END=616 /DNA_ORIENTATION=+